MIRRNVFIICFIGIMNLLYSQEKIVLGVSDYLYDKKKELSVGKNLKEVFGRLGYEMEIKYLPGQRSIFMAEKGMIDGDFPRAKDLYKNYSNLIEVEEPLVIIKYNVYTRLNKLEEEISWDKLKSYKVASVRGVKIVESKLKNQMKGNGRLEETSDYLAAFKMLKSGRVEYIIMVEDIRDEYASEMIGIKKIEEPLEVLTIHLLLNKKHIDIVDEVSEELRKLRGENKN